jgi:hypothetical protein
MKNPKSIDRYIRFQMSGTHFWLEMSGPLGIKRAMEMVQDYIVAGHYHFFDTAANGWWPWVLVLQRGRIQKVVLSSDLSEAKPDWISLEERCGQLVIVPSSPSRRISAAAYQQEEKSQSPSDTKGSRDSTRFQKPRRRRSSSTLVLKGGSHPFNFFFLECENVYSTLSLL